MKYSIVYVPVNADKKMPDSPDYWLASNKVQEGKPVLCRVEGKDAIGYFFRDKNKLWFSYVYYEKIVDDSPFAPYWSDNSDGQLSMEDFDKIEWLEPITNVYMHTEKELAELLAVFINEINEGKHGGGLAYPTAKAFLKSQQ